MLKAKHLDLKTHLEYGVNGFLMPVLNYQPCLYKQNRKHGRGAT